MKQKILDAFYGMSFFVRLIISLVLFIMPVVMLDLPWWADVLIFVAIQSIPFIGTLVHTAVYIWALVVVLNSGVLDVWTILFYVSLAIFVFTTIVPFFLMFTSRKD